MDNKRKIGRPPQKPEYDPIRIQNALISLVSEIYDSYGEIKAVSAELNLSEIKIRKLLITAGLYDSDLADEIIELKSSGKSIEEICEITGLGKSSVNGYLPYSKVPYNAKELSLNAERIKRYRMREELLEQLRKEMSEEKLWEAIVVFECYPFHTMRGLPFSYTIKIGKNGFYNRELQINRCRESKTVVWSSIKLAFNNACMLKGEIINKPKQLGDIRGISYIYPMLYRFGLIEVPETVATKMKRN